MKEVMLNKSFSGSWWLESDDNIPHEIINRYRSDNGNLYIYVPPYGGYDCIKHPDIEHILITGEWHNGKSEVFYKISGLERFHSGGLKPKDAQDDVLSKLIIRIEQEEIKYGGKPLHIIRMSNPNDTSDNELTFPLTFKATSIYQPTRRCFFSNDKASTGDKKSTMEIRFPAGYKYQRQRGYMEMTEQFQGILEDQTLWKEVTLPRVSDVTIKSYSKETSFVTLIQKEYDEITYTNLLYHFLNNPCIFKKFSKAVLNIDNISTKRFEIKKELSVESGRIDLFISTENDVVVIENKLRSGLNGIDKHNSLSQLSTYYKAIEEQYKGVDRHYYLLEPNYNDIDISRFDSEAKDIYKIIKYSSVYEFFKGIVSQIREDCNLVKFADDFISALRIHTLTMEDIVNERFINAIKNE